MKRLLNCTSEDFNHFNRFELKQAIQAAEGRTICSEMVVTTQTVCGELTHAEVARAFGADLMLLNVFDCFNPKVHGLPAGDNVVTELKRLVGRPIGCNIEPVDHDATMLETRTDIAIGRMSSKATLQKANELGFDFVCLTGNPGTGVTNKTITDNIKVARHYFDGLIIAGKMHGAGAKEPIANLAVIQGFIDAGADIIMVPAVGTVPGFSEADLVAIVQLAHEHDVLVMSAIGTSQESGTTSMMEHFALTSKAAGVDIQHIGDAGYGLADVENIFAMSVAIRGRRHTINRMAISVNRV